MEYHPNYVAALAPMAEMLAARPKLEAGDVVGRRTAFEQTAPMMFAAIPDVPGVAETVYQAKAKDGYEINIHHFALEGSAPSSPTPAFLHIHGGGMFLGTVELFAKLVKARVAASGTPIFSVEYRLAPEHAHPGPVEDCYAALEWLQENASSCNVDPNRIGVMGESAGGGIAAGLALLARDRNLSPPLKMQVLIYPMLDDRTDTEIEPSHLAIWKVADNRTGWGALLGDKARKAEGVDVYAAPARATDLKGLPRTYIDVGGLDLFCQEDMDYALRLYKAGVPVEFHLFPGLPHGWEAMAPSMEETIQAEASRNRAVGQL